MMAERAAAAEAMFNSLSSEQQGELRALFDQMMQNMDLNFSLNRLVANLRQATPDLDWNRAHRMRGQDGSPFARAASVAEQLGELKGLEEFLGQSHAAQGLPEVDVEAVRRNLGDDAGATRRAAPEALQELKDQGFVDRRGRRLHPQPKGCSQDRPDRAARSVRAAARLADAWWPPIGSDRARGRPRGDVQTVGTRRSLFVAPAENAS